MSVGCLGRPSAASGVRRLPRASVGCLGRPSAASGVRWLPRASVGCLERLSAALGICRLPRVFVSGLGRLLAVCISQPTVGATDVCQLPQMSVDSLCSRRLLTPCAADVCCSADTLLSLCSSIFIVIITLFLLSRILT